MTKRNAIYGALLAFLIIGAQIDWYVWGSYLPDNLTANDIVQIVGIIVLTAWWQVADAAQGGYMRSRAAHLWTIILTPVGLGIYLFQTRSRKQAMLVLAGFFAGAVLAVIIGEVLGEYLFA